MYKTITGISSCLVLLALKCIISYRCVCVCVCTCVHLFEYHIYEYAYLHIIIKEVDSKLCLHNHETGKLTYLCTCTHAHTQKIDCVTTCDPSLTIQVFVYAMEVHVAVHHVSILFLSCLLLWF